MRKYLIFARILLRQLGEELETIRRLPAQVRALRDEFDKHTLELGGQAHVATMWKLKPDQTFCSDCGSTWPKGGEEVHYSYQEVRCPRLKA